MTFSLALDLSSGIPDFRIVRGQLVRGYESDAARDRLFMRLSTQLGEWVYNTDDGVPYYGSGGILGGKMSQAEVEAIIRRAILSDPEADRIEAMSITSKGRAVRVDATVVIKLASGSSETINISTGA